MDVQFSQMAECAVQRRDQVTVQLDRVETAGCREQASREGSLAGTDFDKVLAGDRMDDVQDVTNDGPSVQEVLAEPFPGTVSQGVTLLLR